MNDDEFLPTRRSLLSRLKRWDDQASWQQFFDTYSRLIYRVAIKAGLTDAEAHDVVQETILVVARKIPGFNYDPALGSFKSWLMLITRRRIEKQLKKRMPSVFSPSARPPAQDVQKPPKRGFGADDTERTATVERIPDPKGFDLEAAWEAEWKTNLWETALSRVKAQIKPKQFQMFDLYALKEWPVKDVARALGVSVTHVYVNRHRVARLLKNEMKFAPRQLVKIPGFTAVAVLALAFSISLGRSHGAESPATATATSFGDKLSRKQANFKGKPYNGGEPGPSLNGAAKVGSYPANPWGLHDMHGNIYEWRRDWRHQKLPGGADPDLYAAKNSATKSEHGGISRSRRGGCWAEDGWPCRTAFRLRFEPVRRYDHTGFRIVVVRP